MEPGKGVKHGRKKQHSSAGSVFVPLWNLLCHKPSEHSCKSIVDGFARPYLDLHSPEDGVSPQGKSAPASLETRGRERLKFQKDFGMLELRGNWPMVGGERSTKRLNFQFDANGVVPPKCRCNCPRR